MWFDEIELWFFAIYLLSYVVFESIVFLLYSLIFVCDGLILPVFEVYETGLELIFVFELALDEFGIGADDVLNLLF